MLAQQASWFLENLQLNRPLLKYVQEATDLPPAFFFCMGKGTEVWSLCDLTLSQSTNDHA